MNNSENMINLSKSLRKNQTPQESKFWYQYCKHSNLHWYRQRILGPYILDFYCVKAKLAIELDGSQHYTDDCQMYDEHRSNYIKLKGVDVLRIPNCDIDNHFDAVCQYVDKIIEGRL